MLHFSGNYIIPVRKPQIISPSVCPGVLIYGTIAAERALYLRRAAGGKFPASVHTDTADQIRRNP
ncbi:UNVERIFIED_ORG: hypothetical protein B5F06_01025 [Lacrimispora saccharolytica]